MIRLGDYNSLPVKRLTEHGAFLGGGDVGDILLPRAFVTPDMQVGDVLTLFVYLDAEERLVATTETPLARVGQFACLRVAWVNRFGAFLDWGLQKDLFVPFREQRTPMEQGQYHVVYVYVDGETQRLAASAKIDRFLQPATPSRFHRGQQVEMLVWQPTPLGFKVVVDNACAGLIYHDQIYSRPRVGDRLTGSVVSVRPDGRLDLAPGHIGKSRFRSFAEVLEEELRAAGGRLPFTDKTPAPDISARFGVSKKTYKQAVGTLYKAGKVRLLPDAVELLRT
ncbi:MAG: GntR family transcriptional regulator [Alloprevotella sp.]|nr:GntR family transcriptional regulator [Alloprevotella sp.]